MVGMKSARIRADREPIMSIVTQEREQIVANALREISHIATLPEITVKVVELVENPRSTAQDLHKVIAGDPALCSRILKVVNSSFYGLPGQIGSINRAIVMLGLNAVKNIAIAASLAKLFRGGDLTPTFSARDLWLHSNLTAVACRLMAGTLKMGLADEAFLAGLIHDIGIMVEMQADRNKLIEVLHRVGADSRGVPATDFMEQELAVFGATHEDFGAGLCERWKFPRCLTVVTGFHHRVMQAPEESRVLPAIVHVADRLAADVGGGFRQDLLETTISADVLDLLKLTGEQVDDLRRQVAAHSKDVVAMVA
jgi:HD-like signal output (HDOD) protein